MKVYDAAAIRNVALVGHSGSGKTQLTSALLFDSGAVNRFGNVDDGTTVTDYDDEEIARKHTLSAGLAATEWNKCKINLVDTPGMGNFLSDARAALRVVEAAIVVVDAVAGVEVSTEKIWAAADELEVPRLIVLNRLDRDRSSMERALESVRAAFGRGAVAVQLPIGEEKNFKGVVDLVSMKSYTFEGDDSGRMSESGVPGALVDAANAARESLIEMVAEADDALMERFFEAGTLTQEELLEGLHRGVRAGRVYPVLCTSALRNIGIQPLLDGIVHYVPAPTEHPMRGVKPGAGDDVEEVEKEADPSGPVAAYVWKTIADQFAGRITLFRVVTGTLKSDSNVQNVTRESQERLGHLLLVQGKAQTHVAEVKAGDIGAVAKLKDTQTGDTLGDKNAGFVMRPLKFPEPVISYAMEPKSRGDEDKISTAMHRLMEEDPSIGYSRDPQTHELLLSGQGQLHIEVTVAKLKRRFGVEVNLKLPRIPYRETITASTEAHGRHKKQTGGHGQFGDCKIRMEPLPRGGDFAFENDIFGGAIPPQFVPAIEKGIQETRMRGYLAGYPVVDFKVTVYDGSYHDVDSNEMSFKMAGRLAFRDAMTRCRPTILEPIMQVEVVAPSDYAGDLMGDLNGRRGRISGMDTRGSSTVIKAQVPMSEMLSYEQQLTSMTGGRGGYHMEFSHYDEVPGHQQTKIIEKSKAERAGVVEEEV
jgi:elongation factor G